MDTYTLKIKNCNSIDCCEIEIVKGVLNIKYGPNGLGKSTIAKAIIANAKADGSIKNLTPFKYREKADLYPPSVEGAENINSVLIFDETYVSQFVFQRDEVLKNSFEIFINSEVYKLAMQEIDTLLVGIKSAFLGNDALSEAISDLKELCEAFSITKNGAISKSSKGFKAYGAGNKIENIPLPLLPFKDFIKSEQPSSWIAWQSKGNAFIDISDNCPYCSSDLQITEKKDVARLVAKEYGSKSVEHLSTLKAVIERLGKYLEDACRHELEKITKSKIELSLEEINFLTSLRGDIETLIIKLEGLRSISFFSLRDVEKIEDEVEKLKIVLTLLPKLDSNDTKAFVDPINAKLQELLTRVGELKGKILKHKSQIAKSISENQILINEFLKSAGYKYTVQILPENDTYKMKLVHQDFNEHLEEANQHLSYGEKNAFALVLFMHQVLKEQPDLAVLDDPVSSFDKTKKFAILNELFRGKANLRNISVLMLTHDLEPAIDVIRAVKGLFQHPKPTASFLSSKTGIVTETPIFSEDIQTFAQICKKNVLDVDDVVIKCIYLRRHFEIINEKGEEYNYISNLLHGRDKPIIQTELGETIMLPNELKKAEKTIQKFIQNFNYEIILKEINDIEEMKRKFKNAEIGYDKIQLYRIFRNLHFPNQKENSVVQKFLNESCHIENEYVMQLNPHKYDNIPEYIVNRCEQSISDN